MKSAGVSARVQDAAAFAWPGLVVLACFVLVVGCGTRVPAARTSSHGTYHRVQKGQTLWSIARAYSVDMQKLARANRLDDVDRLQVGQKLYIPGAARPREVASRCPCKPAKSSSNSVASHRSSLPSPASPTPPSEASLESQAEFIWPVEGTVTRTFRSRGKHRHDGIDISAPQGTSIRAAATGRVIYSDWGPGGYGRIVILRHDADVVTVYAHNQQNLVRVGQRVGQGDPVATVGNSGRASGYHLHFEVRRRTVPVSPFKFLPRDQHIARLERR